MFWPSETRTSTCRNFATISSGLYRFLAIAVLLDVKDIPQVGPLQRGRISIMGHSMGGHGALTIALRNPARYASVSAFSPICSPRNCPWGEKALSGYLGNNKESW